METLQTVLYPLTSVLQFLLEFYVSVTGNYGVSIILLSLTVTVVLSPIAGLARRLEDREQQRQLRMAPLIADIRAHHKGQERFERIDGIYQQFNYHPIKSMVSLLPFLLQIPFLLAALFLLIDYPPIDGIPFLFIRDLGEPDGLLSLPGPTDFRINGLPLLLTGISLVEAQIKPGMTRSLQIRLLIVAAVLLVLIYPLPAGVCLYWSCNNFWSFLRTAAAKAF